MHKKFKKKKQTREKITGGSDLQKRLRNFLGGIRVQALFNAAQISNQQKFVESY